MHRFTALPSSITLQNVNLHLSDDEHVVQQQDDVGLYDGKDKSPLHNDGRLYLTTHRLLFITTATAKTRPNSTALSLSLVRQTEYWTGFLKSSPKITLLLADTTPAPTPTATASSSSSPSSALTLSAPTEDPSSTRTWVCRVCGMKNVPSAQLAGKCSLCGVARDPQPRRPSSSSASAPISRVSTPTLTSRIDRDGYSRTGTPPPLPPPPPSALVEPAPLPMLAPATDKRLPCPVCTYLNHHSMSTCEVCESPLNVPATANSTTLSTNGSSTPTPAAGAGASFVRLSFRKGGAPAFYTALKETLAKRAWEVESSDRRTLAAGAGDGRSLSAAAENGSKGGAGIDAIMRNMTLDTTTRDQSLDSALRDLDALMKKAKEMIQLAKDMNARLANAKASPAVTEGAASEEVDAAKLAQESLRRIGLVDEAVVRSDGADLVTDEKKYHLELARELAGVLQPRGGGVNAGAGLMAKGLVGLDEAWVVWNRARGIALVSPSTLRQITPHLPIYTSPPISLRQFPSGLTILHTPRYSPSALAARLLDKLDLKQALAVSAVDTDEGDVQLIREGMTLLNVASEEQIAVGLGREMVEEVEMPASGRAGKIVRDEQGGEGVRWYRNFITGANWDGHVF